VFIGPGTYSTQMEPGIVLAMDPALDSGTSVESPIVWRSQDPSSPAVLSGGIPLNAALRDCSGRTPLPSGEDGPDSAAAALTRAGWTLPPGALCVNLTELAGGDASLAKEWVGTLAPGGLGSCTWKRGEVVWDDEPLTLARWPNTYDVPAPLSPAAFPTVTLFNWTKISGVPSSTKITTASQHPQLWATECNVANSDCWLHGFWTYDWADSYVRVESVSPDGSGSVLNIDPQTPPVYGFKPKARFYGVSLLSELDSPGEYYADANALWLYVVPPTGASLNTSRVALSTNTALISTTREQQRLAEHQRVVSGASNDPRMDWMETSVSGLMMQGAASGLQFVQFRDLKLAHGFVGASLSGTLGVVLDGIDARGITLHGILLQGTSSTLSNSDVSFAGCTAASVSGGDIPSLTPGLNVVRNITAMKYARLVRTYNPGLGWSGVGNTYTGNSVGFAPHNGWLGSGNNNVFDQSLAQVLCFEVTDSGAWYSGRSWVHRNNTVMRSAFRSIHVLEDPGLGSPSVQAIYNDDQLSANTFFNNTFEDCFTGLLLGGGRRHAVFGNVFRNVSTAIRLDNRGMTWQKSYCTPPNGTFLQELRAVNYQQPPFSTAYPDLVTIATDHPCVPVYNSIHDNCFSETATFLDVSAKQVSEWLDSVQNNVSPCPNGK
jgi:hypothetical protein